MKNNFLLLGMIVLSLTLTFCGQKKVTDSTVNPILRISEKELKQNFKLSDIITDYQFIQLESSPENLIGQIDKIAIKNNKIYILDTRKTNAIFIFSFEGKLISKISKSGRGPGEYLEANDFCFEPVTDNIVIADGPNLKFYKEDGTYLKSITISIPAWRIEFINEKYISFVPGAGNDNLFIVDTLGTKIISYFKYVRETHVVHRFPFIKDGSPGLLFLHNRDYTIYRILGAQISPHITIDFDKNMLTQNDIKNLGEDSNNVPNFFTIKGYFESPSNIVLLSFLNNDPYYAVYNKNSKKTLFVNLNHVENDITGTNTAYFVAWGNDNNDIFFTCINANDLKNNILETETLNPNLNKIINTIQPTDNPVIVLFKFK